MVRSRLFFCPPLIRRQMKYRKLQKDITYIRDRLNSLSVASENGFLLLPGAGPDAEKLAAAINRLLLGFYRHKADFAREKKRDGPVSDEYLSRYPHAPYRFKGKQRNAAFRGAGSCRAGHDPHHGGDCRPQGGSADHNDPGLFHDVRITSGDFPLDLKRENLSQICRDTILDYYDLLEERQFQTDIQIPSPPVFADTDRDALQRILKNLIDNAIRHGGSGKYIALRLISEQGKKIIEVEDHGKGISSQQQKQIFLRNYTTAPHSAGSGLGTCHSGQPRRADRSRTAGVQRTG